MRAILASALGHLGEIDEARRIWRELKEINPKCFRLGAKPGDPRRLRFQHQRPCGASRSRYRRSDEALPVTREVDGQELRAAHAGGSPRRLHTGQS